MHAIHRQDQAQNVIQIRPILIGFAALGIGTLVYLTDRPQSIYFIRKFQINTHLFGTLPNLFGFMGQVLPAFAHAFALSLITAGILGGNRTKAFFCCSAWLIIDCLFELGQYYKKTATAFIPDGFSNIPFLESTKAYFQRGTFDILDIYAIIGGSIIAYGVYLVTTRRSLLQ